MLKTREVILMADKPKTGKKDKGSKNDKKKKKPATTAK
jgi:hypothetical protein